MEGIEESGFPRKPLMSITLPRNFAPSGLFDSDDPKTPDQTFAELKLPPAPHHSTLKIHRPRINMAHFQSRNSALPATLFASDIPIPSSARSEDVDRPFLRSFTPEIAIPSIEVSSSSNRPPIVHSITDPTPSRRFHLPHLQDETPQTPIAQTKTTPSERNSGAWDMHRSNSECSARSDSSLSSVGTFTTRPTSFDGSVTSPDLDAYDVFQPVKVNTATDSPSRRSKKLRINSIFPQDKIQWSIEMDNHLFNIYQMYLADPTVTPFKTVPGSIPPTGVCHRVARRAKETWPRASRISKPIIRKYRLRNVLEDRNTIRDRTPEPNDFLRTDSASTHNDQRGVWPSEAATRKRLKQLCKEKFTITAHYQRLRESRSPSPFTDQFLPRSARQTRSVSREPSITTTYATRELGISLVASGVTAPLAQLVTGDSPPVKHADEWFNNPPESEQMNISPPAGLGIQTKQDYNKLSVASNIPRLASPFAYSTWNGPSRSKVHHRRHVSQNQFDTMHVTGTRLLSPFRPEPDVSSNVNKRRAQHNLEDELSPSGSHIKPGEQVEISPVLPPDDFDVKPLPTQHLVFTGLGDSNQRRIRLRNRGATLGAINGREQLERLFAPPPLTSLADSVTVPPLPPLPSFAKDVATNLSASSLAPPEIDPTQKRLGSPFELDPNKRSNRVKHPRHIPSMSDPFISTNFFNSTTSNERANGVSIGERLAMFNRFHQQPDFVIKPPQTGSNLVQDDPFT